jgi:DMSO/TMAO reductase YedYZ molybdopterin-dependent catalytic subunit
LVNRHTRFAILAVLFFSAGIVFPLKPNAAAQNSQPFDSAQDERSGQLKIDGAVSMPLTLTIADLKRMPRTTLHVMNPHEKKDEVYEGVLLEDLLQKAGVPHGEKLGGRLMTTYVIAEGEDGYKVVFSLAELDSGFLDSQVLVADTMDGASIGPKQGPLRLVAPRDKRPARWVRMLKSITVVGPQG